MYKTKLNKILNLIEKIKDDIKLPIISDFLEWFYEKLNINFSKKYSEFIPSKWEIYFVNLWKNIWSELNKNRPCIVFSDYFFNKGDTIIIVPLKSYKWKINKSINIFLKSNLTKWLEKDSLVDIMWIKQISKKRIWKLIWKIDNIIIWKINNKLLKVLNMKNRD